MFCYYNVKFSGLILLHFLQKHTDFRDLNTNFLKLTSTVQAPSPLEMHFLILWQCNVLVEQLCSYKQFPAWAWVQTLFSPFFITASLVKNHDVGSCRAPQTRWRRFTQQKLQPCLLGNFVKELHLPCSTYLFPYIISYSLFVHLLHIKWTFWSGASSRVVTVLRVLLNLQQTMCKSGLLPPLISPFTIK